MDVRVVLGLALCGLATGCTTVLYDGPQRPPAEVARLVAERGTTIVNVDARPVSGGRASVYEVLPGPHQVTATLSDSGAQEPQVRSPSPGGASVCFAAEAARVFTVSTVVQDWRLSTRVLDRESGENAESACVARASSGAPPARRPAPVERPPVDARVSSAPGDEARPVRTWGGFRLGMGYSFGGDDLLDGDGADSLSAGGGLHVTFGGTLTPLWIRNTVGLGVGGSFGLKYNEASRGADKAGSSRVPAELWLEMQVRVSPRWFVALAGGRHKDYDISYDSDSYRGTLKSNWGRVFDLGLYGISSRHVGWGFGIHYVDLQYTRYDRTYDAGSVGLEFRLFINP